MTNKLYKILSNPSFIKSEIRRVNERIEDLRLMMLPSAIRYDKDKVLSSPSDPMLKYVEKLSDLEEKKKELQNSYITARDKMLNLMDQLDDSVQKDIIQYRFMDERKFHEIADCIQYSEAQTYRIYADALDNLEQLINDDSE